MPYSASSYSGAQFRKYSGWLPSNPEVYDSFVAKHVSLVAKDVSLVSEALGSKYKNKAVQDFSDAMSTIQS